MSLPFEIESGELRSVCERYGVVRLELFGSVLRDDFGPDSDVDVLVEFRPEAQLGFRFLELERELSGVLGNRRVDLVRSRYLNPRLRKIVQGSTRTLYAA